MQAYIVHGALLLAFLVVVAVYTVLRLDGAEGGPLDELLLVLGGAIAGAAVPGRLTP